MVDDVFAEYQDELLSQFLGKQVEQFQLDFLKRFFHFFVHKALQFHFLLVPKRLPSHICLNLKHLVPLQVDLPPVIFNNLDDLCCEISKKGNVYVHHN